MSSPLERANELPTADELLSMAIVTTTNLLGVPNPPSTLTELGDRVVIVEFMGVRIKVYRSIWNVGEYAPEISSLSNGISLLAKGLDAVTGLVEHDWKYKIYEFIQLVTDLRFVARKESTSNNERERPDELRLRVYSAILPVQELDLAGLKSPDIDANVSHRLSSLARNKALGTVPRSGFLVTLKKVSNQGQTKYDQQSSTDRTETFVIEVEDGQELPVEILQKVIDAVVQAICNAWGHNPSIARSKVRLGLGLFLGLEDSEPLTRNKELLFMALDTLIADHSTQGFNLSQSWIDRLFLELAPCAKDAEFEVNKDCLPSNSESEEIHKLLEVILALIETMKESDGV